MAVVSDQAVFVEMAGTVCSRHCVGSGSDFHVVSQHAVGRQCLAAYQAEGAKSGAADVGAAPNGGAPASAQEQDAADIQAVVSAYNQTKGGTK